MNRIFCLFISLLCLLLTACAPKEPSGVLSPSRMEQVLMDYHLAQGLYDTQGGGETRRYELLQSVFRKHHITEAEFDSSMVWYSTNSEKLAEIYARIDQRVQARVSMFSVASNRPMNKYGDLTADGDTSNVWLLPTFTSLRPLELQNLYRFVQPIDSTYLPGDHFIWHFRTDFLTEENAMGEAFAQLTLTFEGDTVLSATRTIQSSGDFELIVMPRRDMDSLRLKDLQGFIYMPRPKDASDTKFRMLTVREMALVRMHRSEEEQDNVAEEDSLTTDSTETEPLQFHESAPTDIRLTPAQRRDAKPHRSIQNIQKVRPVYNRTGNGRQTRRRNR